MSKRAKVHVIIPDIHFGVAPNRETHLALECAARVIEHYKPDQVVQLGDILDCKAFSAHAKSSLKETEQESYLASEVLPAQRWLDRVQAAAGRVHVLTGNHEHRVERFIANAFSGQLAKEMHHLLSPERLLSLTADGKKRKNFGVTPYGGDKVQIYKIAPNLWATHGWSHGKNAARNHLAIVPAGVSIVHGHCHQRLEATKKDPITSELSFGWSPGCMTNLAPSYFRSPSNHVHGFSVLFQSRRNAKKWTHYTVSIVNGSCVLPCGTEISGR